MSGDTWLILKTKPSISHQSPCKKTQRHCASKYKCTCWRNDIAIWWTFLSISAFSLKYIESVCGYIALLLSRPHLIGTDILYHISIYHRHICVFLCATRHSKGNRSKFITLWHYHPKLSAIIPRTSCVPWHMCIHDMRYHKFTFTLANHECIRAYV